MTENIVNTIERRQLGVLDPSADSNVGGVSTQPARQGDTGGGSNDQTAKPTQQQEQTNGNDNNDVTQATQEASPTDNSKDNNNNTSIPTVSDNSNSNGNAQQTAAPAVTEQPADDKTQTAAQPTQSNNQPGQSKEQQQPTPTSSQEQQKPTPTSSQEQQQQPTTSHTPPSPETKTPSAIESSVAPASIESSASNSKNSTPTITSGASSSSTNTGAIAGGVVGGVVGAALIIGLLAFIFIRRRRNRKECRMQKERDDIFNSPAGGYDNLSPTDHSQTSQAPAMSARPFVAPGTASGMDSERYYQEPEYLAPAHHQYYQQQQQGYYSYPEHDRSTVSGPDYNSHDYYNYMSPTSPTSDHNNSVTSPTTDMNHYYNNATGAGYAIPAAAAAYQHDDMYNQRHLDKPDAKDNQY